MARIAPVGYEDRLSIIDHLDELRTRLIWCVAAFIVAFSFCYWQNDRLLNIVNQPLYRSQHLTDNGKRKDPLEQNAVFTRKVGAAAQDASAAVVAQQRALNAVAGDGRVSRATRAALQASQQASAAAAKSLAEAAKATPTDQQRRPITLGVTEPFVTTFTVAGYAALLLCLPFILYQAYAFILPAFTPDEKRHVVPILLMVPCLFAAGVAFGYFVALPRAVDFLQNFNDQSFDILLQAKDYYRFSVTLLLVIGLLFQIPVGVLAVTRLGLVSAKRLAQSRGYVILAIAVVAAVATPTPDPVTMLVAMAPLVVLWEASVLIARIVERRRPKDDEDDDDSGGGGDDDEHEPPADDDLSAWEGDLAPRPTLS